MQTWDSCLIDGVPQLSCLEIVIKNLLGALGGLVFVVLLVMFVIGSITWLTAGDDAAKLKKAKSTFFSALTGLLIVSGGFIVIKVLEVALGINLTKFSIGGQ